MGLLGPDEMTLTLEKFSFKPDDMVKGIVNLSLKNPTKARKLEVALIGKVRTTHRDSDGDIHSQDKTVYDFTLPLDGEKEYQHGQYPFEIKIQSDILQGSSSGQQMQVELGTKLGTLGSVLGQMLTGQKPIQWMIHAHLDIPWKLDVRKSQDIVISQEHMQYENNI
jgi:hypothetical protein